MIPEDTKYNQSHAAIYEQLRLLATDCMLVKRPLVVTEDHVLVGFKEKEWEILL